MSVLSTWHMTTEWTPPHERMDLQKGFGLVSLAFDDQSAHLCVIQITSSFSVSDPSAIKQGS